MKGQVFSRAVAAAILSATLVGCARGPDFVRPDPPQTERYTSQPLQIESEPSNDPLAQHAAFGEHLDSDWWHLFQSDELNDVVARALAGNRTLVAAAATLAQVEELANAQAGTLFPQVGMTAALGRQKYGAEFLGTFKIAPFTYFAVGPTVSYALDYTGGAARSVEQRRALAGYQREQLKAAYLAVTGNTVMQSLRIASLRAQIATVEAILAEDRENLRLIQVAFDAGSVSRLDLVTGQSQLASDATLLPSLHQELSMARHALAVLLGEPPGTSELPDFDLARLLLPQNIPVSLPSELAHRRPDILAAEEQLHAATAAVGVANANLYPHINLTGTVGPQSTELSQLFESTNNAWGIAGNLVGPLFDGGTLRAEHRAAIDALHASAASYQQTVLQAFSQVADSLQALDHDAEQREAQTHALDAARDNVDLTRKSYKEGNIGVLQIVDAERLSQQARLGYVRAEAQRYLDTAQLFLALGGSDLTEPGKQKQRRMQP